MKHILLLLFCFSFLISFSQQTEEEVIETEEQTIKKELDKALQAKDYKLANELLYDLRTENFILNKNGFFVDAMLGFTDAKVDSLHVNDASGFTVSLRFGNKFYLKKSEKASFGVQVTYARFNVIIRPAQSYTYIVGYSNNTPKTTIVPTFSLANVGFTSIVRIGRLTGVEMNFNVGHNTMVIDDIFFTGYNINPNIKFRYRQFAFGVDYQMAQVFGETSVLSNTLSFSLGAKF